MVEFITSNPVPFIVLGAFGAVIVGIVALAHVPAIGRKIFGNLQHLT
jgi:hypothetical protein